MSVQIPIQAVLTDDQIDLLITQITKAGKQAKMTDKDIEHMNQEIRRTGKDGVKSVNEVNNEFKHLDNTVKKIGTTIVSYLAFDRFIQLGQDVIRVTSEFQKFEAVLRNTLGSNSAAQIALNTIKDFAAKTPYSVQQLTASFVKLANQGFLPTTDQLRKLGDLAASTGKEFDMLTEAIIDAQTGEFERLKEFGIRASKEGDRVTFTFKGVKTQVDFTADSIRQYILSLGEAEGVSGAMAAISETLGGKISNLGDSWDNLLNTIGDGNKGALSGATEVLNDLIQATTKLLQTREQVRDEVAGQVTAMELEKFKEFAKGYNTLEEALQAYKVEVQKTSDTLNNEYGKVVTDQIKNQTTWQERIFGTSLEKQKLLATLEETRKKLGDEWSAYQLVIPAIEDYIKAQSKVTPDAPRQLGILEKLRQSLKHFKEAKELAFSQQEITYYNREIEKTEKLIKRLEKLGDDEFLKLDDKPWKQLNKQVDELIKKLGKDVYTKFNRDTKAFSDKYQKENDKMAASEKRRRENEKEGKEQLRDMSIDTANQVFEHRQASIEREIDMLNAQRDREIANAGNNEAAKEEIRKKYARKESQLRNKQAQSERNQAIFNLLVTQVPAVARAFRDFPYPIALGISLLTALQFGMALSQLKSVPVPKYAKGKYRVQGPGTGTSDSIPAMISKDETIVPAHRSTGKFGNVVQAFVEGSDADVAKAMMLHLRGDLFHNRAATDTNMNTRMLKEIRDEIRNKEEFQVHIDENGFRKFARRGHQLTEYINNRYSTKFHD